MNRILQLVLACVVMCVSSAAATDRPNIVFVLTDDQAPTAAGFAGNTQLKTPNMDRLAREGAVLTNSFVATPVCSPSRASLATSRYGSELGIIDWINPRAEPQHGLNPNTVTWMELLQEAGYATGLFGKWHLGTADRFHPTLSGYDEFMGIRSGGCPPKDPVLEIDGHDVKTNGFTVDLVTDHALQFIETHREDPFLVSLHYREPHAAWLPTREEDWEPYKDLDPLLPEPDFPKLDVEKVKQFTREYYASCASVDRNLGRVLETLDRLGLAENTVVVFTSDHGYHNGHHGLWYKGNAHWMLTELPPKQWEHIDRKRRPNLFDQALRVPTVVRWPAAIEPGAVVEQTVSNLDWYPTLLEIAGVELPAEITVRGESIVPLLKGEPVEWDNSLYAEYSMRHGATVDMRAWRTPEWKLMIDFAHEGRRELYHLADDPAESQNLIDSDDPEASRIKQEFETKIRDGLAEIRDPQLVDVWMEEAK
ncbi:MAG: DUF4976 domain-containing protein [Planctomycetota bacterium]|nr:MAG: DUF4976 domain-containing protein [Planctomycetota bacterium]REK21338.1 MAG: DUF4976 domain-containing protein [Planctomycetota bacterium]REK35704.1 MAG: DUF4976 domain-containing protein [Planctomycetota bacterium]